MLRNIAIRSWLRYLFPKIANYVLIKLDFWTRRLKALHIDIIYTPYRASEGKRSQ